MGENSNEFNQFLREHELEPKQETLAVRFDLTLAPMENGYAEFNYRELVNSCFNEREENSEQEMFSSASLTDTPSRISDDIRNKIVGYDTTDSFIDDSENCDEYLLPKLEFGGFYINLQKRESKAICDGNLAGTSTSKAITVAASVQGDAKENKLVKRKSDLNTEVVKPKKCKKDNKPADVQFIKEIVRKPFSMNMKKNPKYNVKSGDAKPTNIEKKCPELPPHLPENLLKCITLLKENASVSKSKKVAIVNEHSQKLFIDFELQLLPFNFKVRSNIYMHLSYYFSLSATTLKRKSKTLIIKKLSDEIDEATLKLASEIQKSTSPSSQQNQNVNQSSVDFSPIEKELLLLIFRLKKKLYDVQRSKTKNFLDHLAELLKDDIIPMWLPSQINEASLVNIASNFYTAECKIKPQKQVKEKQKGNMLAVEKNA